MLFYVAVGSKISMQEIKQYSHWPNGAEAELKKKN